MPESQHNLLPKLPLDDLLAEVQSRLDAVRAARDSVGALLEAVVSIGRELELEIVLSRIVEAARSLADARYAALGVIGNDRQLAEFIPVGISDEEIARMEEWPHGRGILGLLIKEPQTLRLADLSRHPESYGFPDGHPTMKTFLGVPIRIRDEVFGNLYLTEKADGREFDEQDRAIVDALAAAAGVAIENARLYEETRAREIWLEASGEVTRELLSGAAPATALQLVAERAREMAHAQTSLIVLPNSETENLQVIAADGVSAEELAGMEFPKEGTLSGSILASGEPRLITDLQSVIDESPIAARLPSGPAAFVPIGQAGQDRGVLVAHRRAGGIPFTPHLLDMLAAFAGQIAVAMELADARREAERYGLIDDRARIARDLHDLVIQRLFATAMTLTGAVRMIDHTYAADRVRTAVDDLDETIRQIRSSIFALQSNSDTGSSSLRARLMNVADAAGEQLGFAPGVRMSGLLDTDVSDEVAEHALAVAQEALSNVVRHARASRVDMAVTLAEGRLTVRVSDNGVGIGSPAQRSGLANLQERAVALSGVLDLREEPSGGTVVEWQVPTAL